MVCNITPPTTKNTDTNQIQQLIKKDKSTNLLKKIFWQYVFILAIRWAAFLVYMIQE